MDKKLIYTLNGINYLLFEIELSKRAAHKFDAKVKKHRGIIQSLTQKRRLFTGFTAIVKILIPEDQVMSFNDYK